MKRIITILSLTLGGFVCYAQNYSDLYTTYEIVSVPQYTVPSSNYQGSGNSYNGYNSYGGYNGYNIYIPQYEVLDANEFMQSIAPQNVQAITGVYVKNGQFYSVKLKVGISGTNQNQIVVCGYWDGQSWQNTSAYASTIGYNVPEQIKQACAYEVYLQSIGKIYF